MNHHQARDSSGIVPQHYAELARRVSVTATLLGIYWWLSQVLSWPLIEISGFEDMANIGTSLFGVFYGSLAALTMGFLGVELLSLVLPAGRRLRRGGLAGRAQLNTYSLRLVVVVSCAIGIDTCITLRGVQSPYSSPVLPPGLFPMALVVLTGVAATMALYVLAKGISRWGWGNGFCWLLLFFPGLDFLITMRRYLDPGATSSQVPLYLTPHLLLLLLAALVTFFLRTQQQSFESTRGDLVKTRLAAFPQGIVPVVLPMVLLSSLPLSFAPWLSLLVLVVCGLSLLTFHLFSGQRSVEASLAPFAAPASGTQGFPRRQALVGLVVLLATLTILELDVEFVLGSLASHFSLALPILLVAFSLDLFFEARFWLRHGKSISMIELDNPHLATFFEAMLRQQGIDAQVRALTYRQLYFFLEPLIKMELWVPEAQENRARELLQIAEIQAL